MAYAHHFLELIDQGGTRVDGAGEKGKWEKWIEINDWSWDVASQEDKDKDTLGKSSPSMLGKAKGVGSGTSIVPSIFSFGKAPDRSTIRLLSAMHSGEIFKRATFILFEELQGQRDSENAFHLEIVLTDVTVTKCDVSATTSDKEVTSEEGWDFNYKTILFKYDKGKVQVTLTRPPGADTESSQGPVEEALAKAKPLDQLQRKELIQKITALK